MDLFATIADIAHGDKSTGVDSISLVPYLESASAPPQRRVSFAEMYQEGRWNIAVANGSWKLLQYDRGGTPTYDLYNLVADRWESALPIAEDGTSAIAQLLLDELIDMGVP
jgi:hypothetical protein